MKFLSDLKNKNLSDKICLLRVDLNISQINADKNADKRRYIYENQRQIRVNPRIMAILPTIKFLISRKAKVIILSHRGRPSPKSYKLKAKSFTLKPFAKILSKLLKKSVNFASFDKKTNFIKEEDVKKIHASSNGSIFLVENLRFLPGEEKNDKRFARRLASLGDFYVNDDFGVSHRKDASVAAITKYLPSYAGLLVEKEIENLNKIIKKPKRPLVVILGGAKVSDKINLIKNFLKKAKPHSELRSAAGADYILIGGAVANTFFAVRGLPVGDSLCDKNAVLPRNKKVLLPIDVVIDKKKIMDIGPKTIEKYSEIVKKAGTVIWNGPMGYIENPRFAKGSKAIARAIAESKAFSVVGGGETSSLFQSDAHQVRVSPRLWVSTGGGAMLEYLAGKKLPGLEMLKK